MDNTKRLWIGTQPNPDDRLQIVVSEADAKAIRDLIRAEPVTVTNLETGQALTVRQGDCGLGCLCALELVTTKRDDDDLSRPLNLDEAIHAFAAAAVELNEVWETEDHTGVFCTRYCKHKYPFDKSFAEVVRDILHWRDAHKSDEALAQQHVDDCPICTDLSTIDACPIWAKGDEHNA